MYSIWNTVPYSAAVYTHTVFDYCKNLGFINSLSQPLWMAKSYHNCSNYSELNVLLKCQNFNCIDIHVCKFTSCRHTYPVEPQRSYIQVSLQLRGDQIRGIINVHLIQQAPSCCMYDRVQHHACLP